MAREKKQQMDELKKKYSKRIRSRGSSQRRDDRSAGSAGRDETKCTRDEDMNIEEFMRDDMREINKEEDKC